MHFLDGTLHTKYLHDQVRLWVHATVGLSHSQEWLRFRYARIIYVVFFKYCSSECYVPFSWAMKCCMNVCIDKTVLPFFYSVAMIKYWTPCSQILNPWLEDIVDSGIGLSNLPVRLHIGWQAVTTTLCQIDYLIQSGTKNLISVLYCTYLFI